mgnify:FL=1|tara:strand:- start:968 stop:1138 length:171 start_codon:yes stop_codon:yes gene_type:complete
MGCAFNIKIVHPEESLLPENIPTENILKPVDDIDEESSVDTFVIDSPDFEYKKDLE